LTEVSSTGQVEVGGTTHAATTTGPTIPAGVEVWITGCTPAALYIRESWPEGSPKPETSDTADVPGTPPVSDTPAARQEERIRSLERQLADQRAEQSGTRGCLFGALGGVCGALLTCCIPFAYVTEMSGGVERVQVKPFGGPTIYETAGPIGTKDGVKTMTMLAKVVICGGVGAAIGFVIGKGSGSR
jgi:hypothetical protein